MTNPAYIPARYRPAIMAAVADVPCPMCSAVGAFQLEDVTRPVVGALVMRTTTLTVIRCTACGQAGGTYRFDSNGPPPRGDGRFFW